MLTRCLMQDMRNLLEIEKDMTVDKLQQGKNHNNKFVFIRKTLLSTASMLGKRENDISKNLQFN